MALCAGAEAAGAVVGMEACGGAGGRALEPEGGERKGDCKVSGLFLNQSHNVEREGWFPVYTGGSEFVEPEKV